MHYATFVGLERSVPFFVIEWLIVLVGALGNILVIILVAFYDGIKKPVNKLLFINLAVADLGFLVIRHPFSFLELYYRTVRSRLDAFTCKVLEPISMAFFPASLLIIITISYYRYQGIVQLGRSELSMRKASLIVGAIWTSTLSYYPIRIIPFSKLKVEVMNTTTESVQCKQELPETVIIVTRLLELAIFLLLFLVTFVLFLRMRRTLIDSSKFNSSLQISLRISQNLKTLRVLKPVIIVLFLTVTPITTLETLRLVGEDQLSTLGFKDYLLMHHLMSAIMLINSAANPLIYTFASREFRTSFRKLITPRSRRWSKRHRVTPPPTQSIVLRSVLAAE